MNPAHLHLTINELPVMGTFAGVILLSVALIARSRHVWVTAGLLALGVAAIATVVAFLSGQGAVNVVEGLPRTSNHALEAHHFRATVASTLVGVATVVGAVVYALTRRRRTTYGRGSIAAVLAAAFVAAAAMAWTALAGGRINHPELQQAGDSDDGPVQSH